jgi:hypothetical protein
VPPTNTPATKKQKPKPKPKTKGIEHGLKEDELIALELGAASLDELSDAQRAYVGKLKERLHARAEEMRAEEAARREREARNLTAGKRAYESGEYPAAVKLFEAAADDTGRLSPLGGEALMWLALAYQAVGREQECIDTYVWLEANHPLARVRKQAGELRFIMEAPQLELSPEERVTIPLLGTDTWRQDKYVFFSFLRVLLLLLLFWFVVLRPPLSLSRLLNRKHNKTKTQKKAALDADAQDLDARRQGAGQGLLLGPRRRLGRAPAVCARPVVLPRRVGCAAGRRHRVRQRARRRRRRRSRRDARRRAVMMMCMYR